MPSAALDGQEIAQGVSSAPGALAVLLASQATSGSSTTSQQGGSGTADAPQGSRHSLPAQVTAQTLMEIANRTRPLKA